MHYNATGIVYITFQAFFTLLEFLVVSLRIYSRIFLTRSVGSDDFSIVIAFVSLMSAIALAVELLTLVCSYCIPQQNPLMSRHSLKAYFSMRASLLRTRFWQNRSGENRA